jgi:hypothetical protein
LTIFSAVGGEFIEPGHLCEDNAQVAHQRRVKREHEATARFVGRLVRKSVGQKAGDLQLGEPAHKLETEG